MQADDIKTKGNAIQFFAILAIAICIGLWIAYKVNNIGKPAPPPASLFIEADLPALAELNPYRSQLPAALTEITTTHFCKQNIDTKTTVLHQPKTVENNGDPVFMVLCWTHEMNYMPTYFTMNGQLY